MQRTIVGVFMMFSFFSLATSKKVTVHSEFGQKNHNSNTLIGALRKVLFGVPAPKREEYTFEAIAQEANRIFITPDAEFTFTSDKSRPDNRFDAKDCQKRRRIVSKKLSQLKLFCWEYSDASCNSVQNSLAVFSNTALELVKHCSNTRLLLDTDLADIYLDSFFSTCKDTIFNSDNYNLSSNQYRDSTYLNSLMKIFAFPVKRKQKLKGNHAENELRNQPYEYAFQDPFAYDMIERALVCTTKLLNNAIICPKANSPHIFALRRELLLSSIESSFRRYLVHNSQTYLLDLNPDGSKLYSDPIYLRSSASNMKTIRLFEKTAAYIRGNMPSESASFKVSVAIIGHTNLSRTGEELELADYASEILQWYNTLFDKEEKKKPILALNIINVFSEYELSNREDVIKREPYRCELGNHVVTITFAPVNYEERFAYRPQGVIDYIKNNDLVFLLDCPWLSTENIENSDESPLERYCENIQDYNRKSPNALVQFENDSKYFYRSSRMHELSDRFYQLMSSSNLTSGTVVRTLRDKYIKKIQNFVDDLREKCSNTPPKEVYVFSSENDGVNYSYIYSYPLTRIEQYDGKRFTIIQFLSQKSRMLECGGNGAYFEINFWSILKYLCIPFAQNYIVEEFFVKNGVGITEDSDNVGSVSSICYLELLRGIKVCYDIGCNLHNIKISLRTTKVFRDMVKKHSHINADEAIELITNEVFEFVKQLYSISVFPESVRYDQYGDDAIRQGFQMILYSAAKDVNTMLFYHLYQVACKDDDFSDFLVSYVNPNFVEEDFDEDESSMSTDKTRKNDEDNEFTSGVFFADKKLYESLFDTFEQDYRLYLGMIMMLNESQKIYDKEDGHTIAGKLIQNVITACERASMGDTRLCGNARLALKNLSI